MTSSPSLDIQKYFNEALDRAVDSDEKLLLAVSGGSDSMALLHLAATSHALDKLVVGFVDHGLREGVAQEWELVARQCGTLGIKAKKLVIPEHLLNERSSEGIQQWARRCRYDLLVDAAHSIGATAIVTAHTQDDQAETVLLRLLRGTGIDGLGAIPAERLLVSDVRVVRPMLEIARQDLRTWLGRHNIPWAEDPSNQNDKFARVQVRALLPQLEQINPSITSHLGRVADEAQALSRLADKYISENIQMETIRYRGGVKVKCEAFSSLPESLWGRLVRLVLRERQGNLRRFERLHIETVLEGIRQRGRARKHEVPGGLEVWSAYGDLYVFSDSNSISHSDEEQKISWDASNMMRGVHNALGVSCEISVLDNSNVSSLFPLVLRALKPGDLWYGGSKKVSRKLVNRKVPRFYRELMPVMCTAKKEIISMPGILNSHVSGLRIEWKLHPNCALRDLWQFGDLDVL